MQIRRRWAGAFAFVLVALMVSCARPKPYPTAPIPLRSAAPVVSLPRLGFAIQAGAFAKVENAARLAANLQTQGLDATYMPTPSGLYRVRFGDFRSREAARERAETLRSTGLIETFWVVAPEERVVARTDRSEVPALRRSLVDTARSFLGVPYLWGGSTDQGFDCSGLTLAVYQLNGLRLPRSSQSQFEAGRLQSGADLQAGDLVFFATKGNGRVSHVGIYVGDGTFIHAPRKGRKVCVESLASSGFRDRFLGGRRYL